MSLQKMLHKTQLKKGETNQ